MIDLGWVQGHFSGEVPMGKVIVFTAFNGIKARPVSQETDSRKSNKTNDKDFEALQHTRKAAGREFFTNQELMQRLWPAVDSADSMFSVMRKLGGARLTLNTLKAVSPSGGHRPPAQARRAA